MAFEDFQSKDSVVVVYTGEGKGKTSAALGLTARALGTGWRVAFIQFIKYWDVGEHHFLHAIDELYKDQLVFVKSGEGFYKAGSLSAAGISASKHRASARKAYRLAMEAARSGKYDLVICDEINNAVHDGLLSTDQLDALISRRHPSTSLCLTGRDFPKQLIAKADIVTEMKKLKHHFDDKYLANKGIDY
jgi:cob(I)alamin adenosyltransferase